MKKRFSRPLFMDREYIERSLDSFPIEFLEHEGCYAVLYGEDVLADLHIDPPDLRLQIERSSRANGSTCCRDGSTRTAIPAGSPVSWHFR